MLLRANPRKQKNVLWLNPCQKTDNLRSVVLVQVAVHRVYVHSASGTVCPVSPVMAHQFFTRACAQSLMQPSLLSS